VVKIFLLIKDFGPNCSHHIQRASTIVTQFSHFITLIVATLRTVATFQNFCRRIWAPHPSLFEIGSDHPAHRSSFKVLKRKTQHVAGPKLQQVNLVTSGVTMVFGNKFVIALLGLFVVASCSGTPELTRADIQPVLAQQQNLSAISRRFHRQNTTTVNFNFDKDALTSQAKAILDDQAEWIMGYPEIRFSVYGHTDKVGNTAYNDDLGMRRANRVVAYLVTKGIQADRLEALISYGEDQPLIQTNDRELANRRVTTAVSGYFLAAAPGGAPNGATQPAIPVTTVTYPDPATPVDPQTPVDDPQTPADDPEEPNNSGGKHPNSGRGNGDEDGDPGNAGGHNQGGDELA
jgi:outer membrane protein OmpA-like peptidoglycan-associated protein